MGVAAPAGAHSGEHSLVLASEEPAGPFIVTAWTSEGASTGDVPIAVQLEGQEAGSDVSVFVHASTSGHPPISAVLSPAPGLGQAVWEGVLTAGQSGQHDLVIEITDRGARYRTAPIPVDVAVAGFGWAVAVGALAVQALGFLGWLALRLPRVWRRQVVTVS